MKNKFIRGSIAILLCCTMVACTANWITTALNDLPVLIQIATNIAGLVATVQGQTMSPAEIQTINSISAQAQQDLTLIQTLYNDYKANPSASKLQAIQNAIADADKNLPALLTAAHISNPMLVQRITAAVDLILTTIDTFATLIPAPAPTATASRRAAVQGNKPPSPKQLRAAWLAIAGTPLK